MPFKAFLSWRASWRDALLSGSLEGLHQSHSSRRVVSWKERELSHWISILSCGGRELHSILQVFRSRDLGEDRGSGFLLVSGDQGSGL